MARLTVEDCESIIPNRFDLVIIAATRSRDILSGATISLDRDGDKTSVISLREIAARSIDIDCVREQAIRQFQSVRNQIDFDQSVVKNKTDEFSCVVHDSNKYLGRI